LENQEWEGMQLDKDLLVEGNKVYSPSTCVFVDSRTNSLFVGPGTKRDLLIGAYKNGKRYKSQCRDNGRNVHLGTFDTQEDANNAYLKYKSKVILKRAMRQEDERVKMALIKRAGDMIELTY